MDFDIANFLLWKVLAGLGLLVMNVGPTFIFVLISLFGIEWETRGERIVQLFFIPLALLAIVAHLNWLHTPEPSRCGSCDISVNSKRVLTESLEEYRNGVKRDLPPVRTNIGTELKRFELLSWNPPKHFYVTFEDVKTHQVFKSQYVSKHCNSAGSLKAGEEYNIRVTSYTMSNEPGVVYFEFNDLYSVFCS